MSKTKESIWPYTAPHRNHQFPCLRLGHIIANKREIKDFPKLPLATSFIRKTLYVITQHLIYGGLFDIEGNWRPPHKEHRIGRNADMGGDSIYVEANGDTLKGLFKKETTIGGIIKRVGQRYNLDIKWKENYHNNHYHFEFNRR